MKKSICFILAMIYLCCFLTGCETAGLPEMERAEKGGIIFQGNLYVNKTSYGSFKGNVEAKKEKIGWYPGYYFSRMPVYTLGTDEDYVVLWGEQGGYIWFRDGYVFPAVKDCYIYEMHLSISWTNGNKSSGHITVPIPFDDTSYITLQDLVAIETPVERPNGLKKTGRLSAYLRDYDDFRLDFGVFVHEQQVYIEVNEWDQSNVYDGTFYLAKEPYASVILEGRQTAIEAGFPGE